MERARARVVKVRESRERERRDMCSSMATQVKTEARGEVREMGGGTGMGQTGQKVRPQSQMERRGRHRCFGEVLKVDELPGLNRKINVM